MRGFALVRVLIAVTILVLLVALANQIYSGSKTPLRTIRVGPDIVVTCKAKESVMFTGFTLDESKGPMPFMRGYMAPIPGDLEVATAPPAGVSLRLRFTINTEDSKLKVGDVSVSAKDSLIAQGPLPKGAVEIPFGDDVLEYIHTGGKVELNVAVEAGQLVIEYRRPE